MEMALLDGSNVMMEAASSDAEFDNNEEQDVLSSAESTDDHDDDLTNLTWLQDKNLLKKQLVKVCNGDTDDGMIGSLSEDNENVSPPPEIVRLSACSNGNANTGITSIAPVTYDPLTHRNAKPPYSFSSLIFMAIESSPNKALPVKDIYEWIVDHFPFYQTAPSGWKNTVRHNLSLNKCFRKLDKVKDELIPMTGKGAFWCIDPRLRPNLLQAVRRTPAHIYPYMSLAKTNTPVAPPKIQFSSNSANSAVKKAFSIGKVQSVATNVPQQQLRSIPLSPHHRILIPISKIKKVDNKDEEADAAVSMLTLQCNLANNNNNANIIQDEVTIPETFVEDVHAPLVTITVSPSNDHNYFNRNSTPQFYRVIHVTNDQPSQDADNNSSSASNEIMKAYIVDNNNSESDDVNIGVKSVKRKQTSDDDGHELLGVKVEEGESEEHDQMHHDEDSSDEGMRGAEALLNLASSNSNKQVQQQERPIILKKVKKSE